MNDRLNLISGDELLMLDPTDGQETLAQATDVFRYIDRNFEDWKCNRVGRATKETQVQVYEMVRDATFQEMFGGFAAAVSRLTLTQAQIKQFVRRYPDWLKKGGNGTFFLFKVDTQFLSQPYIYSPMAVLACVYVALRLSAFSEHRNVIGLS
jgi:hypothetical protein